MAGLQLSLGTVAVFRWMSHSYAAWKKSRGSAFTQHSRATAARNPPSYGETKTRDDVDSLAQKTYPPESYKKDEEKKDTERGKSQTVS